MKVMPDAYTAYFDLDGTLIDVLYIGSEVPADDDGLIFEHYGRVKVLPKYEAIERLKQHKADGHTVVVWHTGGTEWPKKVLKKLKLDKLVDLIVPKPDVFYDDMPVDVILQYRGEIEE